MRGFILACIGIALMAAHVAVFSLWAIYADLPSWAWYGVPPAVAMVVVGVIIDTIFEF